MYYSFKDEKLMLTTGTCVGYKANLGILMIIEDKVEL